MSTILFPVLYATTLLGAATAADPDHPPALEPLAPLVLDLATPDCTILCPPDANLRRAATAQSSPSAHREKSFN